MQIARLGVQEQQAGHDLAERLARLQIGQGPDAVGRIVVFGQFVQVEDRPVVLGDRHGSACRARLTRRLRDLFQAAGWRVSQNLPYAGGWSTQVWGRPEEGFEAIQIEISRGLYLDEATLRPNATFDATRRTLARVIAALCADTWSD